MADAPVTESKWVLTDKQWLVDRAVWEISGRSDLQIPSYAHCHIARHTTRGGYVKLVRHMVFNANTAVAGSATIAQTIERCDCSDEAKKTRGCLGVMHITPLQAAIKYYIEERDYEMITALHDGDQTVANATRATHHRASFSS
jgi:hypothetical protein